MQSNSNTGSGKGFVGGFAENTNHLLAIKNGCHCNSFLLNATSEKLAQRGFSAFAGLPV